MHREDCILFSGGASGAEAAFGEQAERYGIDEVNFTFEGHAIVRHRGLRVLNHEELLAGDVSLEYVSRLMHRRFTDAPTIRRVLQTLWYRGSFQSFDRRFLISAQPSRRRLISFSKPRSFGW